MVGVIANAVIEGRQGVDGEAGAFDEGRDVPSERTTSSRSGRSFTTHTAKSERSWPWRVSRNEKVGRRPRQYGS
jgi:hypothetical protein